MNEQTHENAYCNNKTRKNMCRCTIAAFYVSMQMNCVMHLATASMLFIIYQR